MVSGAEIGLFCFSQFARIVVIAPLYSRVISFNKSEEMAPPRGFPPPEPLILDGHTSLNYEIATGITGKRNARVATFLTVIGEETVHYV